MHAITISRVSTEDQKIAGNSLPAQERRMVDYCHRNGFEVVKNFSYDESAYKSNRDEFDRIIEYIKSYSGILKVCFDKIDRLSRNVFDKRVSWIYEMAINDKFELHFVSDNQIINSKISATEKYFFSNSLGLAKYFSDAISDNVKRANETGRAKGLVYSSLPEGYLGRSENVILSSTSELITEAFKLFSTDNFTQTGMTAYLNQKGFKTKAGKPLSRQCLFTILRNPFYYGVAKSKHSNYKHVYPTLTTYEIYEKCQEILDRNTKTSRKIKRVGKPYLFRNLLTCTECNRTINPYTAKGVYNYYRCFNKNCKFYQQVVKEEVLEDTALDEILSLVYPEDAIKSIIERLRTEFDKESLHDKKERHALSDEIKKYQDRKSNLLDMLADRSITKDDYVKKSNEYESKVFEISLKLSDKKETSEEVYITIESMFRMLNRLPEIFKSSNTAEKNQILKCITSNSVQYGNKADIYLKKPFLYLSKKQNVQHWHGRKESNHRLRFWRPQFYH